MLLTAVIVLAVVVYFVRELQGSRSERCPPADEIVDRMNLLGEVVRAWRREVRTI